jgi:hypothetical protein
MSIQIPTAFVQGYKANVEHLLQQKGSRLRSAVRMETINSKRDFFEQVGAVEAQAIVGRHGDTGRMDTPHYRRSVTTTSYYYADLIDRMDRVRMLIDPAGHYTTAAVNAMGRAMDRAILAAVTATAYTGEEGTTSTAFDTGMVVDVQTVDPGVSAADTGLNIAKLIAADQLLGAADNDPDEPRFIAINAKQKASLLKTTAVTSADYNSVKALVSGQIDTFMGFKFIQTELVGLDANSDHLIPFWTKSGLLLAVGQDVQIRVSERADKHYAQQVYVSMDIGATRMQEGKVGYIECDPGGSPTTDV